MEKTISPKAKGLLLTAINNALIISIALIILTLVFYLLKQVQSNVEMVLVYLIFLAGLIYGIKTYRDENLGGYISYGQSLRFSVLIGVFTGVLTGIFMFVFYSYIAPELLEEMREKAILESERQLLQMNPNATDAELEMGSTFLMLMFTPGFMAIVNLFSGVFMGLVMGLIVSVFMKRKNPDPFATTEK